MWCNVYSSTITKGLDQFVTEGVYYDVLNLDVSQGTKFKCLMESKLRGTHSHVMFYKVFLGYNFRKKYQIKSKQITVV